MVSDAEEFHIRALGLAGERCNGALHVAMDLAGIIVGEGHAIRQRASAVDALPLEEILVNLWFLESAGPHEHVVGHALQLEDLGQISIVTEGVRVVPHIGAAAKHALERALSVEALTDERLAAGDVDIRLHPPAADEIPTARLNVSSDLAEHARICHLDPLIELR